MLELLGAETYIGMVAYLATPVGAVTTITGMVQHYKNIVFSKLTWKQWSVVLMAILLCEAMVVSALGFSSEAMVIALAMALNITGNVSLSKEYRTQLSASRIIKKAK